MVKFGTSGLRGLVTELNGPPAFAYTQAFLRTLADRGDLPPGGAVCVGRDLRSSSPAIARLVQAAIADAGFAPVDCGALPTPALCLYAMGRGLPAVMVTGSHIPDDRNGLKFYRADGEIDKADEAAILANHRPETPEPAAVEAQTAAPLGDYARRYTDFFGPGALAGMKVGVYQHSSVFRDVILDILAGLGAEPVALGRSKRFVPVDTEAVDPADAERLRGWAGEGLGFAAIVSSDGDADRPLIADERGAVVRGDLVGAIAAESLHAGTLVTPMTSNSGLENNRFGARVVRTAVGSPFVIAGIAAALEAGGGGPVVGFEANGGLILGSPVTREGRTLDALPTRDAVLPILCCLAEVQRLEKPLSEIAAAQGFRAARSSRLQDIPQEASAAFLRALAGPLEEEVAAQIGPIASLGTADGVRFLSNRGEMIYFRASGNAPELRCYVEAGDAARADALLAWGLDWARSRVAAS